MKDIKVKGLELLNSLMERRGYKSVNDIPDAQGISTYERWRTALERTPRIEDIVSFIEKEINRIREIREGAKPPDNDEELRTELRILKQIHSAITTIDRIKKQTEQEIETLLNQQD